jgi:hypothetical protein
MTAFFGALASLFGKLETFTIYLTDRLSATYNGFGTGQKLALVVFFIIVALFAWYVIIVILRFSFKIKTRKLKNIRREYQITLNRAMGKRCNFIWDILLFQKMVIIDDPVLTSEIIEREQKQVLLSTKS